MLLLTILLEKSGYWKTDLSPCPDEDGEYFSRVLINSDYVYFTSGCNYYRKLQDDKSLSQKIDFKRAVNQLRNVERKFTNLFDIVNQNDNITNLLQYNISQVVYQFGKKYPEIIILAEEILKKNNIHKFRLLGKSNFNRLSALIGFKSTFKIRRILSKIFG